MTCSYADLAQLGERKTEDLDVAGSIPAIRILHVCCAEFTSSRLAQLVRAQDC